MDLRDCQRTLFKAIDPSVSPQSFNEACQLIDASDTMSPAERLLVYRYSITGAQQRVLAIVYPVCLQILGDDCFNTLARDYAWHPKSNFPDLNGYGGSFTGLLTRQMQQHPTLNDLPYLNDLARLEWAWQQSLIAADDPIFDPVSLPGLVAQHNGQLIPQLSHSLYLINSPWPLHEIWQSHKNNEPQQDFTALEEPQSLVIHRSQSETRAAVTIEPVDYTVYGLLKFCQQALTLDDISASLAENAGKALSHLPELIKKGWITGFAPLQQET